ncbi:glycosyltransferase [Vibrio sp. PNB23_22_6]
MNKKIILSIVPHLSGGGVERSVIELSKGLIRQYPDTDVHILTTKPYQGKMTVPSGIHVHEVNTQLRTALNIRLSNKAKARLIEAYIGQHISYEPELILCHQDAVSKIMCHTKFANIHHVIHTNLCRNKFTNGNWLTLWLRKKKFQSIYRRGSLVCVSEGVERSVHNCLGDLPTRVIPNGLSVEDIRCAAQAKVEFSRPYLIHVGNFGSAKRHDRLVLAYIASGIEDRDLVLIGQKDKVWAPLVEKILEAHPQAAGRIHVLGFVRNPYPWIARSEGLILSSDYEGLGMVLIEAQLLGKPIISTNCESGPSEIVGESHQHCLSDLSVPSLTEKLREFDRDPSRFITPQQSKFTVESMCHEYYQLALKSKVNDFSEVSEKGEAS